MARMPIRKTLRTAAVDDAEQIADVLAHAFDDDPMMAWFFPDAASRAEGLARYFATIFTRQYGRYGVCERTDAGVSFWVSPEGQDKAVPDAETLRELEDILGDRAGLFREAVAAAAEHGPKEPHWYLAVVGADPTARGRGHGAALLRSGPARADAAGLPVYLESSKESNLPFYEHFGFTVLAEARLPHGGPAVWAMRRAPRTPDAV
ncbi:GNAT family N-acetyltransferase [Streptomyces sp. NPDC057499]|uniref:GNAT family N-acetyltransferase n=1 Tax=Streptomyces sp. NPDC057499 TaxID=3346150 RepID=UPI00367823EE